MKVFLVGVNDAESSTVCHVCATKELAIKRIFELRDQVIKDNESCLNGDPTDAWWIEYCTRTKKNLEGDNYTEWNNFPNETPWLNEVEVEE